jgi:Domain of unknown function (DUF4372)
MMFLGLDLNCVTSICDPAKNSLIGGIDELGQTGARASHAAFAADHVRRCVARYGGAHKVKSFSCLDQYLSMAFAQLTYRESLRDIEACLRAQQSKLYRMGIKSRVSRSTLADANESRDWRIYADFAQSLIAIARRLYAAESFGVDLKDTVYALDAK